jgi:hypothetical protein
MVSSAKEVLNYLKEKFEMSKEEQHNRRQKRSHSSKQNWNAEELENLLHIVRDQAKQVEANMQFSWLGIEKFLAMDNYTLDKIPLRT